MMRSESCQRSSPPGASIPRIRILEFRLMASIHKEIIINAAPGAVWDGARALGEIHTRLCPGFVVNTEMEPGGAARFVTFGNGMQAREVIVDVDDQRRRVVWSAKSERLTHHNGALQVFDTADGKTRAVWI